MAKIFAPNRGFSGLGPAGIVFTDGVAETDNPAALAYFRRAGYGIRKPAARSSPAPDKTYEPEVPAEVHFGSPLRDASIEPLPKDFLPPTNAGEADPHGPLVVSPGIHGVGPAPLVPGPVAVDDPAEQQRRETEVAQAVLVDGQPATDVARGGPLAPEPTSPADAADESSDGRPAKSANKGEWVEYAVAQGMDLDEANALKKEILVERFGG